MQSDARSSSSGSVTTVYVTPDVWARAIPAGDALPTEKMKWSTHDDVRQRRADVVDCCGERERRIGEDNAVHRPTRQEVGDGGWERVRGTTSPSASTATSSVSSPAGNVHGADGRSHSVGRWWPTAGRSRRDKGPARYHDEHWTSRRRRGGNTRVPSGRRTDVRDKDERDRCLRSVVDEERLVDTDVCADGARAGRTAKISVSASENVASEHGGAVSSANRFLRHSFGEGCHKSRWTCSAKPPKSRRSSIGRSPRPPRRARACSHRPYRSTSHHRPPARRGAAGCVAHPASKTRTVASGSSRSAGTRVSPPLPACFTPTTGGSGRNSRVRAVQTGHLPLCQREPSVSLSDACHSTSRHPK